MTKKEILEFVKSRELQLQDILNLPSPALPVLHCGYLRRKANATVFISQLAEVKSHLEDVMDGVQYVLVQPHNLRQYLQTAESYEYKLKGSYCQLAAVHSHGTIHLMVLAISKADCL
jgi:hypothetical protein